MEMTKLIAPVGYVIVLVDGPPIVRQDCVVLKYITVTDTGVLVIDDHDDVWSEFKEHPERFAHGRSLTLVMGKLVKVRTMPVPGIETPWKRRDLCLSCVSYDKIPDSLYGYCNHVSLKEKYPEIVDSTSSCERHSLLVIEQENEKTAPPGLDEPGGGGDPNDAASHSSCLSCKGEYESEEPHLPMNSEFYDMIRDLDDADEEDR